jgi:predicted acylesterase/phospholipase RssA
LLVCTSACTSILRNPVPEKFHLDTDVLGRKDLRFWGDAAPPSMKLALSQIAGGSLERRYGDIMHRQHHYLAISGGGANGAYGAGVLVGWSKKGDRPEFTMVTGISTGALTAPFAFLGPEYDNQLREVYTTLDTSHIFYRRSYWAMLRGEYRRGRALFIGTTNLDASRPVIWNIGRIANSGDPGAGKLIRRILRASASIPGVFSPVYIEVTGPDGRTYEEMHVDGGTSAQLFS